MSSLSLSYRVAAQITLLSVSSNAFGMSYVAKPGDSLSEIAHQFFPGPVWGKNRSLDRLLVLNPGIREPNRIFPNQVIELGDGARVDTRETLASDPNAPVSDLIVAPAHETPAPQRPSLTVESLAAETSQGTAPSNFERSASFVLAPVFAMTSLSGRDSSTRADALVASKLFLSLEAKYFQNWSEHFRTYLALNLGYFKAEPPTDARKSVSPDTAFPSGLWLGMQTDLSDNLVLEGYLAYQKSLFLRSISSPLVSIDSLSTPIIGGTLSYDLVERSPFTFGIRGSSAMTFPTRADGYEVRRGTIFSGALFLKHLGVREQRSRQFETSLGYYSRRQNTSVVEQSESGIRLMLQIFLNEGA